MKKIITAAKTKISENRNNKWVKYVLRSLGILLLIFISGYLVLAWYISNNQAAILKSITSKLNENLNGTLSVNKMEPALLEGFPLVSLHLRNVSIRDTLYAKHSKELLRATDFSISINALALLRGAIEIKKIGISNASIYLFTDSLGYSNTSVFKKGKKTAGDGGTVYPEIKNVTFKNVRLVIDNILKKKNHDIKINSLKGKINYIVAGWKADIDLDAHVKSLAFNTGKGSFIKNKPVVGDLNISYEQELEQIMLDESELEIDDEDFTIAGQFGVGSRSSKFMINIENDKIMWQKASALLSPNISSRLDMFKMTEPISVKCKIAGDFAVKGDPIIIVDATIDNNDLSTPGGIVTNCSFTGKFTNNYVTANGNHDQNSAIVINNFQGEFEEIPISMNRSIIVDLKNPIMTGDFHSSFDVNKLANLVDTDLLLFTKGTAKVNLKYKADIVNYELAKPIVEGVVEINSADIAYVPRNLAFKDISVALNFGQENLTISNIHLRSGKSIVNMKGHIANFLNLYYSSPDKLVLNWEIDSPQLHLGEFIGFLGSRKATVQKKSNKKSANFTQELNTLFEKSNVNMKVRVAKLYYKKFEASNAKADIILNTKGISLRNGGLRHAGGTVAINGTLVPNGNTSNYEISSVIRNVDISTFFKAFENFGIQALTSENIQGTIFTKAEIRGKLTNAGGLVPNSMYGNAAFHMKDGALINFKAIKDVGKYAFPNRDFDKITISDLNGGFGIRGESVIIEPMKFSSSVINMDLEGVYSFGKGTEIFIDVPLRNPERDKEITDDEQLAKRRNRGIVLHLKAADDKDGKVKVKLGSKKDEDE
jgi:hypothetical protein